MSATGGGCGRVRAALLRTLFICCAGTPVQPSQWTAPAERLVALTAYLPAAAGPALRVLCAPASKIKQDWFDETTSSRSTGLSRIVVQTRQLAMVPVAPISRNLSGNAFLLWIAIIGGGSISESIAVGSAAVGRQVSSG